MTIAPVPAAGRARAMSAAATRVAQHFRSPANLTVWLSVLGAAAAAWVMTASRLVLAWDGSNFAINIIDLHRNFTSLHRSGAAVLQAIGLVVAKLGGSHGSAIAGLGAGYALVPAVALLLSWCALEDEDRHLFTWAVIGILLTVLPLQPFLVSESAIACQMSWPIFLATATGLRRRGLRIAFPLAIFVAVIHPAAFALMLAVSAAGLLRARLRGELREIHWLWAAGISLINVVRLTRLTAYERQQGSIASLVRSIDILGPSPFLVSSSALVAGVFLLAHRQLRSAALSALSGVASVVIAVAGGAVAIRWSHRPESWTSALEFRSWVVFATLPLFGLCLGDVLLRTWRPMAKPRSVDLSDLGVVAAVVASFFLAMASVSGSFAGQEATYRQRLDAAPSGCLRPDDLVAGLPVFQHWSASEMSIIIGGQTPKKVALTPEDCARVIASGQPLLPFHDPRAVDDPQGHLDVEPLLTQILGEPPPRSRVRRR